MKKLSLGLVCAACLTFVGCFQSSTLLKINADGSGTIEETMLMTQAALAQFQQMAGAFGKGDAKDLNPFSEDQAKNAVKDMGEGVTFVSSTPIKTAAGEGRKIIYAFTDINRVQVNQQPTPPAGGGASGSSMEAAPKEDLHFALTHLPNGDALLKVTFPKPKETPAADEDKPGNAEMPEAAQMAMMQQFMAGMKIAMAVQPSGRIVHTNSQYVQGNTVTLLEVDFDQLLKDPEAMKKLQGLKSLEASKAVLKDVPGIKVNPASEVTIEFTPGK